MYDKICLKDKKNCLGYKNGTCVSIENCMHKADVCIQHELNLDKINSIEDCKKILKFLCQLTLKPLPAGVEYEGFGGVREYFKP